MKARVEHFDEAFGDTLPFNGPILCVGAGSFLGKELVRQVEGRRFEDIYLTKRCDANGSCTHRVLKQICVSSEGKILTAKVPTFSTTYLLSTVYTRDPNRFKEMIGCNVIFLSELILELSEITKEFIYTNSFMAYAVSPRLGTLYANSKLIICEILENVSSIGRTSSQNVVLYDTFGVGDGRGKILKILYDGAIQGEEIGLSAGMQFLAPAHVSDVARALLSIRSKLSPGTYKDWQLPGREWMTLKELSARFTEATGFKPNLKWGVRPYMGDELFQPFTEFPRIGSPEDFRPIEQIATELVEFFKL